MPKADAYSEQIAQTFLSSSPPEFGSAHATPSEIGALRRLYEESERNKDITLGRIIEHGYPLPEDITPEMVAITGAAHACGVAIDLAETRGVEGKNSTYESYTVKNQFDRFTALHLPKKLRDAWKEPLAREVGYDNPAVVYPEGVDTKMIHGVAKPHRYYPAQTMRYLEFARLGKLDEETASLFGINENTDLNAFAVSWDSLILIIERADNLTQLSADITNEVATQLLMNGLRPEQVAAVLRKGYSLAGTQKEHGLVSQSSEVYQALLQELNSSPTTSKVAEILEK